jgi:hypothetical protein
VRDARARRYILALVLAALGGCTSLSATQGVVHRLTVNEIISDQGIDEALQFEITGRLYPVAPRSIFLTDTGYALNEDERVPSPEECVEVATTASQSRSLKKYEGQIVTLVGSIVRVPVSSDRILMTVTLDGKQQLHPHCQYPLNGGVVPIINLKGWKQP